MPARDLSDRDLAMLDFEAHRPVHDGAKEERIRRELGVTPARYYQLLGRLLDEPAALEHDPMLVNRLRRVRQARERTHQARALGATG